MIYTSLLIAFQLTLITNILDADDSAYVDRAELAKFYQSTVMEGRLTATSNSIYKLIGDKVGPAIYETDGALSQQNKLNELIRKYPAASISCPNSLIDSCLIFATNAKNGARVAALVNDDQIYRIPGRVNLNSSVAVPFNDDSWISANAENGTLQVISNSGKVDKISLGYENENRFTELFRSTRGEITAISYKTADTLRSRREDWWAVEESGDTKLIAKNTSCEFISNYGDNFICQRETDKGYTLALIDQDLNQIESWPINSRLFSRNYTGTDEVFLFSDLIRGRPTVKALIRGTMESLDICFTDNISHKLKADPLSQVAIVETEGPASPVKSYGLRVDNPNFIKSLNICDLLDVKHLSSKLEIVKNHNIKVFQDVVGSEGIPITVVSNSKQGKYSGRAIIEAYGSYDVPLQERYLGPYLKYWVNEGGIYVFAHVRGSAGFGSNWRNAGLGTNKANSIEDLISVGKHIIAKYNIAENKTVINATSAGGIIAGAALYKEPDIFAGANLTSPCLILIKVKFQNCVINNEFGDINTRNNAKLMEKISPAHLAAKSTKKMPILIHQMTGDKQVDIRETDLFLKISKAKASTEIITVESPFHAGFKTAKQKADAIAAQLNWIVQITK